MGQLVEVAGRETLDENAKRFEVNRWLTGMGGRLYFAPSIAPSGALLAEPGGFADAILSLGDIKTVYVYGNQLVVTKQPSASWSELEPGVIEILSTAFEHYPKAG